MDFTKAFDLIKRDLLFDRLQQLGVDTQLLAIIKSMYESVSLRVVCNEGISKPIRSFLGVKQGCCMSPTLFGLFIDEIEEYFALHIPSVGARILDVIVAILLYADDLCLCAESASDLQLQLDILHRFCEEKGLVVNVAKSEVVVFTHSKLSWEKYGKNLVVTYNGNPLKSSTEFRYLGCILHAYKLWGPAINDRISRATSAFFLFTHRCKQHGLDDVRTKLHLLNTYVRPVLTYGCEMWGVSMCLNHNGDGIWKLSHDDEYGMRCVSLTS